MRKGDGIEEALGEGLHRSAGGRWAWAGAMGFLSVALMLPMEVGGATGTWRDPVAENLVTWHGMEAGLPLGGATCMMQDVDGYLWFGTFGGAARFDGIEFKVFDPMNTPVMTSYAIVNGHRDRAGTLWFSMYDGMVSRRGGTWRRHGRNDGWTTDYVRTFAEAPGGTLYVTGFDGKVLRLADDGRFQELPTPGQAGLGGFGACDRQGRLLVAKDGFVGVWTGSGWRELPGASPGGSPSEPLAAGPSRDGGLWVLKGIRLIKVDATGAVQRFEIERAVGSAWGVHEDASGDLWVTTTRDGVCHVQLPCVGNAPCPPMARVTRIGEWGGRSFKSSRFVSEDSEGNVWMGTASDGLARLRGKVVSVAGPDEGLGLGNFRSATVDGRGRLWVTTSDGGVFRCESPGSGTRFRAMNYTNLTAPEAVLADRQGRVWATGSGPGKPVFQLEEDHARVVFRDGEGAGGRWGLFEDSMGRVWVAGGGDLLCHGPEGWQRHALPGVVGMAEDTGWGGEGDGLLASNDEGLWQFTGGKFTRVHDSSGRTLDGIACLWPARGGGFWLGGMGRSLGLLGRDRSLVWMGPAQGLPIENVTTVVEDASGRLWVGGDRGVARLSVAEAREVAAGSRTWVHARMFGEWDGMPANGHAYFARQPKVATTADGRLWFPTTRGLAWIGGNRVKPNERAPILLPGTASYVDAAGTPHELEWRPDAELRIPAGARSVRLGFAALNYAAPRQVMATARLGRSGITVAERHGGERHVTYELLPPGRYSWHVMAANEDGVRNDVGLRARFMVEPHYWQTAWFRWGAAVGLLGAVMGVAGYWVRHARLASRLAIAERDRVAALESAIKAEALRRSEVLRHKAEAEAEWRRQREAVVRDVHDGIGGIASNLKMTLGLVMESGDPARQRRLLANMDSMVRQTMSEVQGLMDAMENDAVDPRSMFEEFHRYALMVLSPHGIQLVSSFDGDPSAGPGSSVLFLGLFRVVKEALANVVKHSKATQVTLAVVSSREGLRVVVADDGVGLLPGHRAGRGLASMRRRTAELGGSMEVQGCPGVRLRFDFPWSCGRVEPAHAPSPHELGPG